MESGGTKLRITSRRHISVSMSLGWAVICLIGLGQGGREGVHEGIAQFIH
jgi:hypothetical protein